MKSITAKNNIRKNVLSTGLGTVSLKMERDGNFYNRFTH